MSLQRSAPLPNWIRRPLGQSGGRQAAQARTIMLRNGSIPIAIGALMLALLSGPVKAQTVDFSELPHDPREARNKWCSIPDPLPVVPDDFLLPIMPGGVVREVNVTKVQRDIPNGVNNYRSIGVSVHVLYYRKPTSFDMLKTFYEDWFANQPEGKWSRYSPFPDSDIKYDVDVGESHPEDGYADSFGITIYRDDCSDLMNVKGSKGPSPSVRVKLHHSQVFPLN